MKAIIVDANTIRLESTNEAERALLRQFSQDGVPGVRVTGWGGGRFGSEAPEEMTLLFQKPKLGPSEMKNAQRQNH